MGWALEQELVDFAHRQTLGQVIERAVLGAAVMTAAAGLAASGEAFDDRGAQEIGGNVDLLEEKTFALADRQGGFADEIIYPSHIYN